MRKLLMFSAVGAGLAGFLYFGVYPLFRIYSELRRENLDIDVMATILRGLPLLLAYLPPLFCAYYAYIQARRLRAGEIHFTTAQKFIRIALPGIIALSAFVAAHVLVLSRLPVVFLVPQALDKYELFRDDRFIEKAPAFEPELLDSRPFDGYQINASAAVITLSIKKLIVSHNRTRHYATAKAMVASFTAHRPFKSSSFAQYCSQRFGS